MSQSSKRLSILLESEINELYSPSSLTSEQRRHYFSLNDIELDSFNKFKDRYSQLYLVLLLGYFKIKPVILNFTFSQVKDDFKFVASEYFPDNKFKQQNLSRSQKSRIYNRIFNINHYNSFSREISHQLQEKAIEIAAINIETRYIFDECIDYLSRSKTAIPSYSQLQRIISTAANTERQKIVSLIESNTPKTLSSFFNALF